MCRYRNSQTIAFLPATQTQQLYSGFLQDEFDIVRDRLSVVVGSKFEHNAFTGKEMQPNVRLAWTPSLRTTVWASVSRAVRTPSLFEEIGQYTAGVFPTETGLLAEVRTLGSPNSLAEILRAHEIGYRSKLSKRFSMDWTGFYNVYHNLTTYEPAAPFVTGDRQPFHLVTPRVKDNKMRGESQGMEIMGSWEAARRWRISSSYSLLRLDLHLDPSSADTLAEQPEGRSPRHQLQFSSEIDLSRRVQFDTRVYHVGSLPSLSVPSYTRIDARLGWRPGRAFEFSAGGQNLQGGRHLEFVSEGPYAPSRVGRSFYTRIVWRSE
jgi:iron complex outermembrane receptor protein